MARSIRILPIRIKSLQHIGIFDLLRIRETQSGKLDTEIIPAIIQPDSFREIRSLFRYTLLYLFIEQRPGLVINLNIRYTDRRERLIFHHPVGEKAVIPLITAKEHFTVYIGKCCVTIKDVILQTVGSSIKPVGYIRKIVRDMDFHQADICPHPKVTLLIFLDTEDSIAWQISLFVYRNKPVLNRIIQVQASSFRSGPETSMAVDKKTKYGDAVQFLILERVTFKHHLLRL